MDRSRLPLPHWLLSRRLYNLHSTTSQFVSQRPAGRVTEKMRNRTLSLVSFLYFFLNIAPHEELRV